MLELRRLHVSPHLPGSQALGAEVLGDKALSARWRLGNGQQLRIDLNLGATPQPVELPPATQRLFDSSDNAHPDSTLAAHSCVVSLLPLPWSLHERIAVAPSGRPCGSGP